METIGKWRGRSLIEVAGFVREMSPSELCRALHLLCAEHSTTFNHSLDLVASHGLLSPQARAMMSTDLVCEMCPPGFTNFPGDRVHTGSFWIDQIEIIAIELAKRLFGVRHAELRPQSGAIANQVTIAGLVGRGDTIMAQSRFHGGHPSTRESSCGGLMNLKYIDVPFCEQGQVIDLNKAEVIISRAKPKLLVIGSALIRFPYAVRELKQIAESLGTRILYDGAHALGLMAGGQYQNPINEGADVVTGSTQKTLCGPIGGLIITNSEEIARRRRDRSYYLPVRLQRRESRYPIQQIVLYKSLKYIEALVTPAAIGFLSAKKHGYLFPDDLASQRMIDLPCHIYEAPGIFVT